MWLSRVLLAGLLCASGCVAPDDDPAVSNTEQADWDGSDWDPDGEVIIVEGDTGGWDPGWWFPGPGGEGTVQPPVSPGGGGAGKPPPKKPLRKDCTEEDYEACCQCCEYSWREVDGYDCRKIPDPAARAVCWQSIFPATLLACCTASDGIPAS